MLSVRRGRAARLLLVGVLLLPLAGVARAASPCRVTAPDLGVDLAHACAAVRAAVPSWDGRGFVTVGGGDPDVAAETLGTSVQVHPDAWARLTPAGRQVVLTHELVHVATDAFTTDRTPTWLVEGFAEAIALRDSGIPDRVVAQELAAQVARGDLPTALPTTEDFTASPAIAYQESWLAVDLLLRRLGAAAVLEIYREAGHSSFADALALVAQRLRSESSDSDRRRLAGSRADVRDGRGAAGGLPCLASAHDCVRVRDQVSGSAERVLASLGGRAESHVIVGAANAMVALRSSADRRRDRLTRVDALRAFVAAWRGEIVRRLS